MAYKNKRGIHLLHEIDKCIAFIDGIEEETISDSNPNTSLVLGTWNVHRWRDGKQQKASHFNIMNCLETNPVDIFATQESNGKHKDLLCSINGLKYSSIGKQQNGAGVALFSKYPIITTIGIKRMQLSLLKLPDTFNGIIIGVINVHFNYQHEKTRMRQYKEMLEMIKEYTHYPLVLLGDMNALNPDDYSSNEWNQICNVRECNNWETPQCDLMTAIYDGNHFVDCLYLLKGESSITKPNNKHSMDSKKCKKKKKKTKHKVKRRKCSNDSILGDLWENVLIGTLGTCRFDTRIDYIFVNQQMRNVFGVKTYQHCQSTNCSDHKLVIAELILRNQ
eukprot:105297_1